MKRNLRNQEEMDILKAERSNPALVELLDFYNQWSRKYPQYEFDLVISNCGNAEIEALATILESDELPEAKRGSLDFIQISLSKYDQIELNKYSSIKAAQDAIKAAQRKAELLKRNNDDNFHSIVPC